MSRILLVSANTRRLPYPVYPLGMSVLAAGLASAGHEVAQRDMSRLEGGQAELEDTVRALAPDVVGVSVRNVDDTDSLESERNWQLDDVRELVAAVRRATRAPIVMGGPGFSLMPRAILEYTGGDHGVSGPGVEAMLAILDMLDKGQTPPAVMGGCVNNRKGMVPSALMDPDLAGAYARDSGILGVQTKIGCPARCLYCSYPAIEGAGIRTKDPKQAADEAEEMVRRHGAKSVVFTDAVFNDPGGRYLLVAEELARRGAPVPWSAFFTPRGIGPVELDLLVRSGMIGMEMGTDGSTDETLAGLRKDFTFAEAEALNRECVSRRIPCVHYIIFGGPGETPETVERGLDNLRALAPSLLFIFTGLRVYPHTPLHALAVAQGILAPDRDMLRPVYYFSPDTPQDMLHQRLLEAAPGMRHALYPPDKAQNMMAVSRKFGLRGILWDTLIRFDHNRPMSAGGGNAG